MLKIQYDRHLFLSYDPVITAYIGGFNGHKDSITPDFPAGIRPDILLEHVSWNLSSGGIHAIKKRYQNWYSETERMLVVNTTEEESLLKQIGVPGFQCGHDIYLPHYDFVPLGTSILYDAIYTARLSPFKRHYLTSKLKDTRMLTGGVGAIDNIDARQEDVDSSNQIYLEYLGDKSVCFERLDTHGVCAEINKSYCGLALSAEEGMMCASSEYLLCGRPVVSTRSSGGRDIFYNDANSLIVEDDPDAIQKSVQYWVENPPDNMLIRRNYLQQLNAFRYDYARRISLMQKYRGGKPERPERIFYDLFIDKDSYRRRLLGAESIVSKTELSRILGYPETEIVFRRSSHVQTQHEDTGYRIDGDNLSIRLDELSSWILSRLDGQSTITSVVNDLVSVYGDADRINRDVRDTISKFIESGVIEIANDSA